MARLSERVRTVIPGDEARNLGRRLAIYALLGVLSGLSAVFFLWLVKTGSAMVLGRLTVDTLGSEGTGEAWGRIHLPEGIGWLILVVPAAGALLVGLFSARFAPEVAGSGTGFVIETFHRRNGVMRRRVPWAKALVTTATLSTGGSAGVEGPIGQIAASLGSSIARWLKLGATERRILLMAGYAAGIGAIFHAPMAAAMLATEILYREMDSEYEILVPAIISSTVAYATFGAIAGWKPLIVVPSVGFGSMWQLVPYSLLAIVVAAGSVGFAVLAHLTKRKLGKNPRIPLWFRPTVGALGVGLIGIFLPQALGAGYGILQSAIDGNVGIGILLLVALAKTVATSLTLSTGSSGGHLAPSLAVGGALGGAVGLATVQLAPHIGVHPAAFVVVGMAGFFAAASNAPLSTVIMVSEVVGSYRLIVPALWVCAIAWLLTRRWTLFEAQVPTRLDVPFRLGDMMSAVLHRMAVRDALDASKPPVLTVRPDQPLREIVRAFATSNQAAFPICDPDDGRLLGVVDGRQLRRTVGEGGLDSLLIANDFQSPALTIQGTDTLFDAISRMSASGYDELVVVDDDDPYRLVGLLSRREIITAYHRRFLAQSPDDAGEDDEEQTPEHHGGHRPIVEHELIAAIRAGGVFGGVSGETPEEALRDMIERARLPEEADSERLIELFIEREALGSTGVGDGIALPHPHADEIAGIDQPMVIIGMPRRPIPWNAYDGRPVDTICALVCPSGDVHLRLLGALARALQDPVLLKLLRRRASTRRIINRLGEIL